MELSPKQQAVELIKNAKKVLILGHKNSDGDLLGASLALSKSLTDLGKSVELVISEKIPETYAFLPFLDKIKKDLMLTSGKVLRINTKKIPVSGVSYQKNEDSLDIILEADKNLKFEFVNIINGATKPDAIIVLDTPDVEKIDTIYDKNTELFFEVPIINIDHHAGNEYFGSVNLVDLTASSTSEILVSLFEALGVKISDADTATCLLTGIISDTQSFRSQSTTPKSLTVAAQLLAAGGRQQEIISYLYKKRPVALMKLWGEMLSGISQDKKHHFAWTKVGLPEEGASGITPEDVLDASDELLSHTPEIEIVLVICGKGEKSALAKITGSKDSNVLPLAELFGGTGTNRSATFTLSGNSLEEIELKALKKIHDYWSKKDDKRGQSSEGSLWDVVAEEVGAPKEVQPSIKIETVKEVPKKTENVIDSALKSIAEEQLNKENSLAPLSDIIKTKKQNYLKDEPFDASQSGEIDVFDEDDDGRISELTI